MANGPSGDNVRHRLRELRERQRLSYAELSRMLDRTGRDIPPLGLRRIEAGDRRVDVDDLVALAVVLGVSPATLLMPPVEQPDATVTVTGAGEMQADRLWQWLTAYNPLTGGRASQLAEFWVQAWPRWELDDDRHGVRESRRRLVLRHPAHRPSKGSDDGDN